MDQTLNTFKTLNAVPHLGDSNRNSEVTNMDTVLSTHWRVFSPEKSCSAESFRTLKRRSSSLRWRDGLDLIAEDSS